jgi:hypothetical protein
MPSLQLGWRLSGSSTVRPARTFWRRLEPVGWPLALMCFGPKHRSGCALHVPTSGAKKRRNRNPSCKVNRTHEVPHELIICHFCSPLAVGYPPKILLHQGRGLEKPKLHFSQHLHAPERDGVERAFST